MLQVRSGLTIPAPGVSITVNQQGTQTAATIYSDDGITTKLNPLATDANGRFDFYIANGRYDLIFAGTGFANFTQFNVEITDAMDVTALGKTPIVFTANNTHSGAESFTGSLNIPSGAVNPATCTQGALFYNTTSNTTQNCTAPNIWSTVTPTPVPGVFNSNFDPPLFQNYTLTVAGAQTGINLTATPIDTHTISWRLSPGTLTPLVDSVPYANGDLHAANANWVYQSGTFNVSASVIYGSAASSFANRSDGANTANEFAQATLVETVGNVAQNHGPCVRMQPAAQTAYCIQAATDILRLVWINAGAFNQLASFDNTLAITGDVVKIQASGTLLSVFKNGVLLGTANDSNITSGLTGLYSAGNANSNGVSNFQSAALPTCTVALDSSPDNVTFASGGVIPGQFCGASAGSFTATQAIANYVRVNATALSAGQTLTVVYSGRLAPAPPSGNNTVNNGFWVQPGQALWVQYSSVQLSGNFTAHQSVRIANGNAPNSITTTTWDITTCNCGPGGGAGTGILITQPGWLQSFTVDINSGAYPQGFFAVNLYVLNQMPPGGGTSSCQATGLSATQIGALLGTWPAGSFYPVGFVGTAGQYVHPWSIPGYTNVTTQANPAAGAEWLATLTANGRTCIQSVSFTAAAGSTNITPTLLLKLSGNAGGGSVANLAYTAITAQTSATTQNYSFSPGAGAEAVTGTSPIYHIVPFNNGQMVCYNGGLLTATIGTLTTGLNGTTQYSNIAILTQVQNDNN